MKITRTKSGYRLDVSREELTDILVALQDSAAYDVESADENPEEFGPRWQRKEKLAKQIAGAS